MYTTVSVLSSELGLPHSLSRKRMWRVTLAACDGEKKYKHSVCSVHRTMQFFKFRQEFFLAGNMRKVEILNFFSS
jgi:hypothetical protein